MLSYHARLASAGLVERRESATLGQFVADFIKRHAPTVKASTVTTWRQCERLLLEHFAADTPLRAITEGDAVEWRAYLLTRQHGRVEGARKLSEATIRPPVRVCENLFSARCPQGAD